MRDSKYSQAKGSLGQKRKFDSTWYSGKRQSQYHQSDRQDNRSGHQSRDDADKYKGKDKGKGKVHSRSPSPKKDSRDRHSRDRSPLPPRSQPPASKSGASSHLDTGKGPISAVTPSMPSGIETDKNKAIMAANQKRFPDLNFSRLHFAVPLDVISAEAADLSMRTISDAFMMADNWHKVARRFNEVANDFEHKNNALQLLIKEAEDAAKAQAATIKKLEAEKVLYREENFTVIGRSKELEKEVEDLKAALEASKKETMDAQLESEKVILEKFDAEKARDKAVEETTKAKKEYSELLETVRKLNEDLAAGPEAAARAAKKEMEDTFSNVIAKYNSYILRYRGLSWLDKSYPQNLADAVALAIADMREEIKVAVAEGECNPDMLTKEDAFFEAQLLQGDEPTVLAIYRAQQSSLEKGETSSSIPATTKTATPPPAASEQTIPEGDVPLTSPLFERAVISPFDVANMFRILSNISSSSAAAAISSEGQGTISITTDANVIATTLTAPVVDVSKTPSPGAQVIHALLSDEKNDDAAADDDADVEYMGEKKLKDVTLKELKDNQEKALKKAKEEPKSDVVDITSIQVTPPGGSSSAPPSSSADVAQTVSTSTPKSGSKTTPPSSASKKRKRKLIKEGEEAEKDEDLEGKSSTPKKRDVPPRKAKKQ